MKKIKVSRKLDKFYDSNIFYDFTNYCEDFYTNLLYIKKYYQQEFDSKSENSVSIDAHIEMFSRTFKQIVKTVNSPKRYDSLFNRNKKMKDIFYEVSHKFSNLKDFHSEHCFSDDDIQDLINEKYYGKLVNLCNIIFTQEEIIALTTQQIWHNYIAKSIDDIKSDKFCCLVKVLSDWRMESRNTELDEYMNSRYAMSVSLITNLKSRFFYCHVTPQTVGIIYSTDKIIAGRNKDAFLEEFIDGKCPLNNHYFNPIRQTCVEKNHTIYSLASKIATPNSVLLAENEKLDTYNEVIIDRRESSPIAVFYVNRKDETESCNKKAKMMATKMAQRFNLPLVELEEKNLLLTQDENNIDLINI